jgi:DNA-binding SARP family transcriptional activator/tetratricopeptide (TPR) repeat protein
LDVTVHGRSLALTGSRAPRLLALLAVNCNEVVPLERIVDTLWDDPPSSARQQVHNVVGGLRKTLTGAGDGVTLVTSSIGYRLTVPRTAVDVLRFQARLQEAENASAAGALDESVRLLRSALSEWRGPALSGLPGRELAITATALHDRRLAAVEQLANLNLLRGDTAGSLADLFELVEEFPFRESLRAVLMRTLHLSGRQADALAVFDKGRQLLADELGLDPGAQLRAAHQQVLTGETDSRPDVPEARRNPVAGLLPEGPDGAGKGGGAGPARPDGSAEAERPASGPGAGPPDPRAMPSPSGRRFLPRDIPEFTGRGNELRRLLADARENGTTTLAITAINGMGGVGKTTIAVHLAHLLADDYPDGQYFVDLQGFSAGADPMPPEQALNLLLRDSGVPPELVPPDLEGRSALWRSRLAGQRVLLLLDNAVDAAQVRPLLPGTPGALVLISSRRRMTSLEGAVPLSLDVMPRAEAAALFTRIVGPDRVAAEPQAMARAIELCGRLPLAIQVAAARLRDREHWSIEHVVEQLRDQGSRSRFLAVGDRDVMGVLNWSYRYLEPGQQRFFRLLSVHPGPDFDAHAAAALAGVALDEAATCLEELFDANLLQQHAPRRYRFHDLVRDCSQGALEQRGDPAEKASATERILDYYLRSANQWCGVFARSAFQFSPDVTHEPPSVKPAGDRAAAMELLETEHRNLAAAARYAAQAGFPHHAWQLTCAMLPYFAHLNYGAEAEDLCRQALVCARAVGSDAGESVCLMGLAQTSRARGSNAEGRELAAQAIELSGRDDDARSRELYQRTGLGAMYLEENLFEDALSCFTTAWRLARDVGDREAEADLTNNLGVIHRELGRLHEAQRYFRRTLVIDGDGDASESQALTLCNIAQTFYLQGRYADAAAGYDEALRLSRSANSPRGQATALIGLCVISRRARDFRVSLDTGRQALEMARNAGLYDVEGDALGALGDTYLSLGDPDTAAQVHDGVRAIGDVRDSARYRARAHEGQAHVAAARGDGDAAARHWSRALAVYPGGVVDAAGARRHLAARSEGEVACWRCSLA